MPYHEPFELSPTLSYEAYDAGHILGSSCIVMNDTSGAAPLRLTYSGDVGRPNLPIIRDPERMPPADYLILESTYGGRLHKQVEHVVNKLADVVNRTARRGGRIIVPAFAVGRTQQLVLLLHQLFNEKRIPNIPIFVDSPLALNVTEVHRDHPECFDAETRQYLTDGEDPFGFKRLQYIREAVDSKKLNDLHGPFVVISASGMCEQGRILHHLRNNIEDPRNTVLITGFQAQDTLGRKLVEKWPEVRIFGEPMRVRAEISSLDELSGHADQGELLEWIKPMVHSLRKVFLVHGEPRQSETLAQLLHTRYGLEAVCPAPGQSFDLIGKTGETEIPPVSIYTVVRKAKGVLFRESNTDLSRATAQEFGPAYRACRRCPDRTGRGQHLSVRADRPPARRRFEGSGVAVD